MCSKVCYAPFLTGDIPQTKEHIIQYLQTPLHTFREYIYDLDTKLIQSDNLILELFINRIGKLVNDSKCRHCKVQWIWVYQKFLGTFSNDTLDILYKYVSINDIDDSVFNNLITKFNDACFNILQDK